MWWLGSRQRAWLRLSSAEPPEYRYLQFAWAMQPLSGTGTCHTKLDRARTTSSRGDHRAAGLIQCLFLGMTLVIGQPALTNTFESPFVARSERVRSSRIIWFRAMRMGRIGRLCCVLMD